ncbi:hypothetical protein CXG81DRAFT_8807 [Caulochytrium protostelioides]|uniref:Protein DOM34 homolog n=1 Tax=Caulochytrium protostelioides TaxID=1555241 RepID=A0A4P9XEH2_9FUNG|nr:hypothetical protein CXG81DRAFT_8807 [Caulochytrium protostelioides]|eukprot:RKP03946.1 hypothetical protein CXG81DRAFT_8807 [Caulochytrium protostelioides]
MKILARHIEKDRSGRLVLIPEENEDLWHLYNIITAGDRIKGSTVRRVVTETSTGSVDKHAVKLTLVLVVATVDYDVQGGQLRVKGTNQTESPHIKLGAYHTLAIELNRQLTIYKDEWDTIVLDRIRALSDVSKRADIAAVVMEEGLAHVCLITESMTVVVQRIESTIPRKRRENASSRSKAMDRFYEQIYQAIARSIDFSVVKALVLASPGFVKNQLLTYLMTAAVKSNTPRLAETIKEKAVLVHCSTGHKHALTEIMADPGVQAQLKETKFAQETRALEEFFKVLAQDRGQAFYGYDYVARAAAQKAVTTLLVTDGLFRSADIPTRKRYIRLVEQVKRQGGTVYVFSTLHSSGEQLEQLTGIAALLSYPMPDLEEEVAAQMEAQRLADDPFALRDGDELIESDPNPVGADF